MADDDFNLDDLFEETANDWPYSGPRSVTLMGVRVEVNDALVDVTDDGGAPVSFEDKRELDLDRLPAGYETHPLVFLILNMIVDDKGIPEPLYPPKVRLGNTNYIEINSEGTAFRYLSADGSPRAGRGNTGFATFTKQVVSLMDEKQRVTFKKALAGSDRWYNVDAFDGFRSVWNSTKVGSGQYAKVKAWPVSAEVAAGGDPFEGSVASLTINEIAATATDANDFRNRVVNGNLGDAGLLQEVITDPAGSWSKYQTV